MRGRLDDIIALLAEGASIEFKDDVRKRFIVISMARRVFELVTLQWADIHVSIDVGKTIELLFLSICSFCAVILFLHIIFVSRSSQRHLD